jgi:putative glutamine amidotransferase
MRVALSFTNSTKAEPYREALNLAGLDALPFSPDAAGSLDRVRGLMLTGGHDVDPKLYGAVAHPETDPPDRAHDDYECALLRAALARQMPVLAICRGMQLFNVVCGGTLVQHLPGTTKHRQRTGSVPVHQVELEPLLVPVFGAAIIDVNSRHHQAVDRVGKGLVITAADPDDGVIEGISLPTLPFAHGVQWHPEDMLNDPKQVRLFRAFAVAVAG